MPVLLALVLAALPAMPCAGPPVAGPIIAPFSPGPGYSGHWGVDFEVAVGTAVKAVAGGTVTFAGRVVDNLSVTVHHGGTMRTSYSFLGRIDVESGEPVVAGDRLGASGRAHGRPGLHFSVRVGDAYRDPTRLLRCGSLPAGALRLISIAGQRPLYAVRRAARDSGRNLRSPPCGTSHGGRGRAPSARS